MATIKLQFANENLEVTSVTDESGELWLLANPFARVLEYSNAPKAISTYVTSKNQLCLDQIKSAHLGQITSSSLHPKSKFINRAGLFELIQSSRMPKAQEFRQSINSDLLPKLCDDGKYEMAVDAPPRIADSMNAVHVVTSVGAAEAPWMKDLDRLERVIARKDEIIAVKDEENNKLTLALQEVNKGLLQAFNIVNEARKETAELANRMADIAQDVIAKPSDPQLLHSLAVCALGGDRYAFVRPQKRSLKRSLGRLGDPDIVFRSDYVPNSMNVLNKVKETLAKDKYKARHNKITLLEDLSRDELIEAINSSLVQRQLAAAQQQSSSSR